MPDFIKTRHIIDVIFASASNTVALPNEQKEALEVLSFYIIEARKNAKVAEELRKIVESENLNLSELSTALKGIAKNTREISTGEIKLPIPEEKHSTQDDGISPESLLTKNPIVRVVPASLDWGSNNYGSVILLQRNNCPIFFIGDTHGDPDSLKECLSEVQKGSKVILGGDYIDRGKASLQVLMEVALLQACYPSEVIALQGNHEYEFKSSQMTGELNSQLAELCVGETQKLYVKTILSQFPVAAMTDSGLLCVHGAPPEITSPFDFFDDRKSKHKKTTSGQLLKALITSSVKVVWGDITKDDKAESGRVYAVSPEQLAKLPATVQCVFRGHQVKSCPVSYVSMNKQNKQIFTVHATEAKISSSGKMPASTFAMVQMDANGKVSLFHRPTKKWFDADVIEFIQIYADSADSVQFNIGIVLNYLDKNSELEKVFLYAVKIVKACQNYTKTASRKSKKREETISQLQDEIKTELNNVMSSLSSNKAVNVSVVRNAITQYHMQATETTQKDHSCSFWAKIHITKSRLVKTLARVAKPSG